jgi:hypothetical protein
MRPSIPAAVSAARPSPSWEAALMKRIRTGMLAVVVGVAALALATSTGVTLAQESDETGQALCEALSSEDLSELLGGRYQAEPGFEYCSWNLASPYNISASWQTGTLEDSKQYWTPGKDVTVGGRPGWLAAGLGTLLIQLDNGIVVVSVPTVESDIEVVEAMFMQLGERFAASAASLAGPSPTPDLFGQADPDLVALFPPTVGFQPLIATSMSGEVLLMSGEERLQPLVDALAAQGLAITDLSLAYASSADFATNVQAIRVKGGDVGALAPILVELFAQGAVPSEGEVAGKPVTVLTTSAGTQYIYASGEVVWLVAASEPALSEVIAALP